MEASLALLPGSAAYRSLTRDFAARCALAEQLEALMCATQDQALVRRATEVLGELDDADQRLFARVRARLRAGRYTRAGLIRSLGRHAPQAYSRAALILSGAKRAAELPDSQVRGCGEMLDTRHASHEDEARRYAPLDVLLAGLLDAGELPEELPQSPEMVAYQPAPGRVILALLEEVRDNDVVYDLGSGLGRVVICVALLTAARAKGIEFQPSFCAYATIAAQQVGARKAEFLALDARDAPLDDGTLFFLYTPFRGAMLRTVLAKLHDIAAQRAIRICSFGPCTPEVLTEPWLHLRSGSASPNDLTVFDSLAPKHRP